MKFKTLPFLYCAIVSISLSVALSSAALATEPLPQIPGPADVGRIKPEEIPEAPDHSHDQQITVPGNAGATVAPESAKTIHFTLKAVTIRGATVFTPEQLADTYADSIGKDVTLDIAWKIAETITERYHNAGYFLSRAYVPQQRITDGVITIDAIEGYIGKVELPNEIGDYYVLQWYMEQLTAQKPVTAETVESFLLRINDLPGYSFRAVLAPLEDKGAEDAAIKLTLVPTEKDGKGSVSVDNYSSRYLGPQEGSVSYSTSLLPWQQTTVTGLSSLPADKLRYGTLDHIIPIAPDVTLEMNGGATKAYPDYTLEKFDIDSLSTSGTLSLNYQWLRQRQEDLALKFSFDNRDVTSDILHTPQTRDRIRALRASATYDLSDEWQGYNVVTATVSQGIDGLDSSNKSDPYLSRAGASPAFTKAELFVSRLQNIVDDWSLFAAASGQEASGILYSSEQFGYGGQSFGRAYDASEITGDRGVSGSLELRYGGFAQWQPVSLQPYAFYDIGEVWNQSFSQPKNESGASAGFGLRFATQWHESANFGIAWPLTHEIPAPIYGGREYGPRLLLQLGQEF